MQVCRWEFLVFNGTFKTLLRVHEAPKDGKLVFSLIKSSFMKDFVGQWQVSCWRPASYTAALGRCRCKDAQLAPLYTCTEECFQQVVVGPLRLHRLFCTSVAPLSSQCCLLNKAVCW